MPWNQIFSSHTADRPLLSQHASQLCCAAQCLYWANHDEISEADAIEHPKLVLGV